MDDSRIDWRRVLPEKMGHESVRLPYMVERQLLELNKTLNLNYSASDMIVTPDGDYIYLETNANGQWYWLEQLTGLPMTSSY